MRENAQTLMKLGSHKCWPASTVACFISALRGRKSRIALPPLELSVLISFGKSSAYTDQELG